MAEPKRPFEIRLQDPLSPVTRSERKTLLGVSAVAIVIARSGLVPTKISALGIDFNYADQKALLTTISAVIMYFLIAFASYAASDFAAWRAAFHTSSEQWHAERRARNKKKDEQERRGIRDTSEFDHPGDKERQAQQRRTLWSYQVGRPVSAVRIVVEFAIPIAVGGYAVFALLTTTPTPAPPQNRTTMLLHNPGTT